MEKIENFPPILGRVVSCLNVEKNHEVASALGVTPSTVSNWKERGDIPILQAVNFALREEISVDWILTGKGKKP